MDQPCNFLSARALLQALSTIFSKIRLVGSALISGGYENISYVWIQMIHKRTIISLGTPGSASVSKWSTERSTLSSRMKGTKTNLSNISYTSYKQLMEYKGRPSKFCRWWMNVSYLSTKIQNSFKTTKTFLEMKFQRHFKSRLD